MTNAYFFLLSLLLASSLSFGQHNVKQEAAKFNLKKYRKEIHQARKKKNKEFKNTDHSPLSKKAQKKFKKLAYFPIDATYRVNATMELTPDTEFFEMTTSDGKVKLYRQYALLHFMLKGKKHQLPIYRGRALMRIPKYRNYLFIPFTDLTNGKATYGAGRYMEFYLKPNQPKEVILDFNTAYNPYCAYNTTYSCPIPPRANHLPIKIEAGEKQFNKSK
ncbi:hypothetical protein BKI52_12210 [marine bacterium AO1-C]|nr:hypothetical protein BKI52_12210 [marine bacterium AO1-C]